MYGLVLLLVYKFNIVASAMVSGALIDWNPFKSLMLTEEWKKEWEKRKQRE